MKSRKLPTKNICFLETEFIDHLATNLQNQAGICIWPKPEIYVVDNNRGRAIVYWQAGIASNITIPKFVYQRGVDYTNWYIAHELAHLLQKQFHRDSKQHDRYFMQALKLLCPARSIHFETEYKPRNTKAAGISKSAAVNTWNSNKEINRPISAEDL